MSWQPIETAPKDGTPILLWTYWEHYAVGAWDGTGWYDGQYSWSDATHWMPLPASPEDV
jgi:hypothetical protein